MTTDESLAGELAALINRAYEVSEGHLFVEEKNRTTPEQVRELIRAGGMLVARRDGVIAGCAAMQVRDDELVELGFMSALPGDWGAGVGRALVKSGEAWALARGATTMQMKLLVPSEQPHALKQRLREWYERLGYRVVRAVPFGDVAGEGAAALAAPAEFLVFRRELGR